MYSLAAARCLLQSVTVFRSRVAHFCHLLSDFGARNCLSLSFTLLIPQIVKPIPGPPMPLVPSVPGMHLVLHLPSSPLPICLWFSWHQPGTSHIASFSKYLSSTDSVPGTVLGTSLSLKYAYKLKTTTIINEFWFFFSKKKAAFWGRESVVLHFSQTQIPALIFSTHAVLDGYAAVSKAKRKYPWFPRSQLCDLGQHFNLSHLQLSHLHNGHMNTYPGG